MFENMIGNIRSMSPLVHNITNYVTANDCANILLASGASPIMAEDILEVEEITSVCDSLVINLGTLNQSRIPAMVAAGKRANELGHPVILDPVGVGASRFRKETLHMLLQEIKFSVMRGNISEIKGISSKVINARGVDAEPTERITEENLSATINFMKDIAKELDTVIVITGAIDLIVDTKRVFINRSGHSMMSNITGSGCMLSSLLGALCAANRSDLTAACAAGVCAMGLSGEYAYKRIIRDNSGSGSFKMHMIDYISKINDDILRDGARASVSQVSD